MIQTFGTTTVRILKSNDTRGIRVAEIRPALGPIYHVPAELLPLAAGKDAWMREIQVRCAGCKKHHRAGDLGSGLYCPACVEEAERENAELDGRAEA